MSEYKSYPQYKDSGDKWIGEIPVNWVCIPIKKIARLKNGSDTIDGEKHEGLYPVYSSGGLFGKTSAYLGEGPSVMFGRKGTIDKPFFVETGKFWHVDTVFRSEINCSYVLPKMFFYISKTINFKFLSAGAAVPSMTQTKIHDWKVALPPLETQQKIVDFLDTETSHIDAGIANMESLIALLTEKRAALILETVTRGIPGEHTEFKDSGVAWLGDIPTEWKIVSGKKVITTHKEIVGDKQDDYQRLSLTMAGVLPKSKTSANGLSPESFSTYQIVRSGEFIFKMIDLENRKTSRVGLSHDTGLVSSAYIVASPKEGFDKEFGYYYYTALYNEGIYNFLGSGVRSTLNADDMKNIPVCLPSFETQQEIVKFLDSETAHIDAAISSAKSMIELMREKRQTLISDAVTGKINVTNNTN